ncbi:hypothetical protein D3C84_1234910 [compost metagenome]
MVDGSGSSQYLCLINGSRLLRLGTLFGVLIKQCEQMLQLGFADTEQRPGRFASQQVG